MNIVAPVRSLTEVEMLLTLGADELYCGVVTPEWQRDFGTGWWLNRRDPQHANCHAQQELEAIVAKAHDHEVPVYITLNTSFYPSAGMAHVERLARFLVETMKVDGLIVADLNFLIRWSRLQLPVRVHLSSLGGCFNSWAVEYYRELGVRRIILPRQLRLSEIEKLVKQAAGDMEFEVFALNDGCLFEEGFCQTTHGLGSFCLTDWKMDSRSARLADRLEGFREYRWFQNNCGSTCQPDGTPNGPCSLCWFGLFNEWGIKALKIVGREASFYRKMRSLQLVQSVMQRVKNGASNRGVAAAAQSLRNSPEYCRKGMMCYFKDPAVQLT